MDPTTLTRIRLPKDERGAILVTCLLLILVMTFLGAGLFQLAVVEGRMVLLDWISNEALYCAEGGAARAIVDIMPAPNNPLLWDGTGQTLKTPFRNGTEDCVYVATYENTATPKRLTVTGTIRGQSRTVRYSGFFVNPNNAILIGGDVSISGNPDVTGACGRGHVNGDVMISGNPDFSTSMTSSEGFRVSGSLTAGGMDYDNSPPPDPSSCQAGGTCGGGQSVQPIPPIKAEDFLTEAKARLDPDEIFQMKVDGRVLDGNGALIRTLRDGQDYRGWKYSRSSTPWDPVTWEHINDQVFNGTYYLEGFVKIGDSPGGNQGPWRATVLAAGNLEISGNPKITAHLTDTVLVTSKDLKINGNPNQSFTGGLIGAHEQLALSGNPNITDGFFLIESSPSGSEFVKDNEIGFSGNPNISYNCGRQLLVGCWPKAACRTYEEL